MTALIFFLTNSNINFSSSLGFAMAKTKDYYRNPK